MPVSRDRRFSRSLVWPVRASIRHISSASSAFRAVYDGSGADISRYKSLGLTRQPFSCKKDGPGRARGYTLVRSYLIGDHQAIMYTPGRPLLLDPRPATRQSATVDIEAIRGQARLLETRKEFGRRRAVGRHFSSSIPSTPRRQTNSVTSSYAWSVSRMAYVGLGVP